MNFRLPLAAATLLGILGTASSWGAGVTRGAGVCTTVEQWTFSSAIPQAYQLQFATAPRTQDEALKTFTWGFALARTGKNAEARALGDFQVARAILQLDLPHLAHRHLEKIIVNNRSAATVGIENAALDCMALIRKKIPALRPSADTVKALKSFADKRQGMSSAMKQAVAQLLLVLFKDGLAAGEPGADELLSRIRLLANGTVIERFATMLRSAADEKDTEALQAARSLAIRGGVLPVLGQEDQDIFQITLARIYFNSGDVDRAIATWKKVSRSSYYFAESYSDLAWAYLGQKKYQDATSTAYNLLVGGMSQTFAPDAAVIVAIAFYETCHFPEALRAVGHFKKHYGPTYQWLSDWLKKSPEQRPALYQLVLAELKADAAEEKEKKDKAPARRSGIPRRIVGEWMVSPALFAHQQEINLAIEQKEKITALLTELRKRLPLIKDTRRLAYNWLVKNLTELSTELGSLQARRAAEIETALMARSRGMVAEITETAENNQLVEVEILNAAGEDIIVKNARPEIAARAEELRKARDSKGPRGAVLDWGKFPAGGDDAEIWEDELGFLRSDMASICVKKR